MFSRLSSRLLLWDACVDVLAARAYICILGLFRGNSIFAGEIACFEGEVAFIYLILCVVENCMLGTMLYFYFCSFRIPTLLCMQESSLNCMH